MRIIMFSVLFLIMKMIELPSKDQNSHDNDNDEKHDHSDNCSCDYSNLHVVILIDIIYVI